MSRRRWEQSTYALRRLALKAFLLGKLTENWERALQKTWYWLAKFVASWIRAFLFLITCLFNQTIIDIRILILAVT